MTKCTDMDFRVSVCLTKFFNDERSFCYVHIDDSYESIASLELYLRSLFNLRGHFCLMCGNNYLPSREKIKIICAGDTLTVVPLQKGWGESADVETEKPEVSDIITQDVTSLLTEKLGKKKKKKKAKQDAVEHVPPGAEDEPVKKEKNLTSEEISKQKSNNTKKESVMDVSMPSDIEKGIFNSTQASHKAEEDIDFSDSDNESNMEEPIKSSDVQTTLQQLKMKALAMLSEAASQKTPNGVSGGRINKRKRIRKKKKKHSLSISTPDLSDSGPAPPVVTYKTNINSSSHIRFDADQPTIVQNAPGNRELSARPRIVRAVETPTRTPAIEAEDDGKALRPSNGDTPDPTIKDPQLSVDSVRRRLSEFPVMDAVPYPVPKDLILFKMLRLSSDYSPTMSDHILGSVLAVDKASGLVNLSILDGRDEVLTPCGKFQPNPEHAEEEGLHVDVAWSQVVEPRLIFP